MNESSPPNNPETCTEDGCVCLWCQQQDDMKLNVAMSCVMKELARRAGISLEGALQAAAMTMDPALTAIGQQYEAAFVPDKKDN